MRRRLARELALTTLFQMDLAQQTQEKALQFARDEHPTDKASYQFALQLVTGVWENHAHLDEVINQHAVGWTVKRMATVDRNILRIGCHELLYSQGLPSRIAINEAVEMAKKYGNADSAKFINGVLGTIARQAVASKP